MAWLYANLVTENNKLGPYSWVKNVKTHVNVQWNMCLNFSCKCKCKIDPSLMTLKRFSPNSVVKPQSCFLIQTVFVLSKLYTSWTSHQNSVFQFNPVLVSTYHQHWIKFDLIVRHNVIQSKRFLTFFRCVPLTQHRY